MKSAIPKIEGDLEPIIRGDVRFGKGVRIAADWKRSKLVALPDALIEICPKVFINNGVLIVARDAVIIGWRCLIGNDVIIMDSNQHTPENIKAKDEPRIVVIGSDVWIGSRAIILPGVHIQDGAVIGAGSVVTKNVPGKTLVAGNPAREVRKL